MQTVRWPLVAAVTSVLVAVATTAWAHHVAPGTEPGTLPPKASAPGWLGVGLEKVEDTSGEHGHPLVRIKQVFPGSPAETVGLRRGDIVLAVAGTELVGGVKEMVRRVQSFTEGTEVRVDVLRDGTPMSFHVQLGKRPDRRTLVRNTWKGKPLPELALRDVDTGEPIDLVTPGTRAVVLEYWATWCGPCKRTMPRLESLWRRYHRRGLRVVGASNEAREVVARFAHNRPIEYDVVAHDAEHRIASELYVTKMPTFIVMDGEGKVVDVFVGASQIDEVERVVRDLVQ